MSDEQRVIAGIHRICQMYAIPGDLSTSPLEVRAQRGNRIAGMGYERSWSVVGMYALGDGKVLVFESRSLMSADDAFELWQECLLGPNSPKFSIDDLGAADNNHKSTSQV